MKSNKVTFFLGLFLVSAFCKFFARIQIYDLFIIHMLIYTKICLPFKLFCLDTYFEGVRLTENMCFKDDDCINQGEWCPVLRVCSYAECICPWGTRSKLPSCQIICAHLDKKSVNSYNPCGCNYK